MDKLIFKLNIEGETVLVEVRLYKHHKTVCTENWLWEKKLQCRTGESNLRQYCTWLFAPTLYQLSYLHHAWGRISSALFKSASRKLCFAERWSQEAAWITPTPSLPLVTGSPGASTRPRWQPSCPYSPLCSLSACWRCTSTSQRDGEGSLPVDWWGKRWRLPTPPSFK